jgi:SsrA-binding protein
MGILAENRKAKFDYTILQAFQAGLVLNGQEVKSIRLGRMNLTGSYVALQKGELFLVGSQVPRYQPKNAPAGYSPERSRKLLVRKQELNSLIGKSKERGLTLLPLRVYTQKHKIKLEFALAKGQKKYDKREKIKKREADREIERELKRG